MVKIFISRIAVISFVMFILLPPVNGEGNCDYAIEILIEKELFEVREFNFKARISKLSGDTSNISAKISIEDGAGNTVKEYFPWKGEVVPIKRTSNAYTPNLKKDEYMLKASVSADCEETYLPNNEAVSYFTIYEKNTETDNPESKKTSREAEKSKTSKNTGQNNEEQRKNPQTNSMRINADYTDGTGSAYGNSEFENEDKTSDLGIGASNQNYAVQNFNEENKKADKKYNQKDEGITAAVLINPLKNKNTDDINSDNSGNNQKEGKETVYEDSTLIAKKVGLVLLILVLVFLNVVLVWKR